MNDRRIQWQMDSTPNLRFSGHSCCIAVKNCILGKIKGFLWCVYAHVCSHSRKASFNLKTIIFTPVYLGECQHLFLLILFVTLSSKLRKWPLSWFYHLWCMKKCQYIWLKNHLLNHPPRYARACREPSKILVTPPPRRVSLKHTELAYMQCNNAVSSQALSQALKCITCFPLFLFWIPSPLYRLSIKAGISVLKAD